MAARRRAVSSVDRRIHFYRANPGVDDSGRVVAYDVSPHLRVIQKLPFSEQGRYQAVEEDQYLCCWPEDGRTPRRLVFRTIRRSGLPQVERAGSLGDLNIPTAAGLAEAIHVVFFADNIVGADFNFYGPRMSRLGSYLRAKADSPAVEFEPLLRQDIVEQVRRLTEVRLLRLRVNRAGAAIARRADESLFDALGSALRAGAAEEIEVVLRMSPHSRRWLGDAVRRAVRGLVGSSELLEAASAFTVKGLDPQTGRVEEVDVLRDHFIVTKQMMRVSRRGRALVEDSAFSAIREAHNELADSLRQAASVG